jgi:hypothetical protein
MAFMAVLESDLRALSSEARRRYPAVKDGAEHAILKVHIRIQTKKSHTFVNNYYWFLYVGQSVLVFLLSWIVANVASLSSRNRL